MRDEELATLPREATFRGIERLKKSGLAKGALILGFDCEYESEPPHGILLYQLSDGKFAEATKATEMWDWPTLAEWVMQTVRKWGHSTKAYSTFILVSHFSTAELSHIKDFHIGAKVRRVSPQQVYNASYRIDRNKMLVVFDQFHFWNTSLANVAATWGEEKMSYDTTNVTKASLDDPKFMEYALWDAVVCQRTFVKFRQRVFQDHGLDIIKYPTPASLAMAVFRLAYQEDDFKAPHGRVRKQAWRCLWGGRAEAYRQGDAFHVPFSLRDVKSLYPTSAVNIGILPRAEDWMVRREPRSWRGLCTVQFEFPPHVRFPCLPVNHDGRLLFPLKGTSHCTLDEAKVAHDLGAKLRFLAVMEYDTGTNALTRFMLDFIARKDKADAEGDEPGRAIAKLMMNASIGKFSQHRGEADVEDFKEFAEMLGLPLAVVMDPKYRHPTKPKGKHRIGGNIMPEWSALILGRSRAVMGGLLNEPQLDADLCSTDSLLLPSSQDKLLDTIMGKYHVVLDNKNAHCHGCCGCSRCMSGECEAAKKEGKKACKKPGRTSWVRIIRNRVYAAMCEHGNILFGASHAIHLPTKSKKKGEDGNPALDFILSNEEGYRKTRRAGLKTAIRKGVPLFHEEANVNMAFERRWDMKRKPIGDGTTVPWKDTQEYDLWTGQAGNSHHSAPINAPPPSPSKPMKSASKRPARANKTHKET